MLLDILFLHDHFKTKRYIKSSKPLHYDKLHKITLISFQNAITLLSLPKWCCSTGPGNVTILPVLEFLHNTQTENWTHYLFNKEVSYSCSCLNCPSISGWCSWRFQGCNEPMLTILCQDTKHFDAIFFHQIPKLIWIEAAFFSSQKREKGRICSIKSVGHWGWNGNGGWRTEPIIVFTR